MNYEISDEITDFLLTKEYTLKKVLFAHPNKKRQVLLVENNLNDEEYLLKWNCVSNSKHLKKLQKEIEYYKDNCNNEYLPLYISSGGNYLVLKYYRNACTIRDYLFNYLFSIKKNEDETITDEFKLRIHQFLSTLSEFQNSSKSSELNDSKAKENDYFNKLLASVPNNNKKKKLDRFIIKVLYFIHKKRITKTKMMLQNEIAKTQKTTVHGDMHLNNIIVTEHGIKIIDWENNKIGTYYEDFFYSSSFILGLLSNHRKHYEYVYRVLYDYIKNKDNYDTALSNKVLNFYLIAISVNRDFSYKLSCLSFVKNLIEFKKKLIKLSRCDL